MQTFLYFHIDRSSKRLIIFPFSIYKYTHNNLIYNELSDLFQYKMVNFYLYMLCCKT